MKYVAYLAFAIFMSGCSTVPPKILDTDIYTVEVSKDGNEVSRSKVTVYLNNEGTDRASVRFEASFYQSPSHINRLYIWDENVPVLRDVLKRAANNSIRLDDISKPYDFGVHKGAVKPIKTAAGQYITVLTQEGIFVFPISEIPEILAVLDSLEQAAVRKK